eukprot:INCI5916.2.p1 GENE.INCI5916.2~~INCI5916.2.p1  ORF type:complete len:603 (+),score=88.19 INCI5916.2:158-1810(+)
MAKCGETYDSTLCMSYFSFFLGRTTKLGRTWSKSFCNSNPIIDWEPSLLAKSWAPLQRRRVGILCETTHFLLARTWPRCETRQIKCEWSLRNRRQALTPVKVIKAVESDCCALTQNYRKVVFQVRFCMLARSRMVRPDILWYWANKRVLHAGEKVAQLSAADRQWLFDRLVSTNYLFFIPQTYVDSRLFWLANLLEATATQFMPAYVSRFPKFCKSRAARQFAFVHSHEWLQRTQKTQGEFQGPFSIAHVDTRALKGVARAALDARLAELADGYLQLVVVTGPLLDDTGRVPDSICSTLGSVANTSVTAAAEDGVVDLDLTDTVTDDVPPPPLLCATDTAVLDSLSPFNDENDVDVDYSRLYYGVWNGGTRTFVLSSELLLLPEHGGSAHRARHAGYQRRWLKFQLHLALLTAEQTMLVLDDPILSPNSSPLMREAGPEAVSELQHWLLDLIAEFNVGAVFMSDRGGSEDLEQAAQLFDALLEEKGFSRSTPVESSKQRIATFRYTMTEDTQRHANGTPCTLSLLRSSADAVGTVKVHLKNLEVSALSLA